MNPKESSASPLACDADGNIIDIPNLSLAGQIGRRWEAVPPDQLIPIPEGTKLFFLPGTHAVVWDHGRKKARILKEYRAVAAMLQAGYVRTHLPASFYPEKQISDKRRHEFLPLWAYACVGWKDDRLVAAAFRVDPMSHSETCQYDDRVIAPKVRKKTDENSNNRLINHLARCALEYHCFAAKNWFMERWEAPLPTAPACNAACLGCISLQPADCCPACHERIEFVPTVEELCEVAIPHLKNIENAIVSFGQGCEGEPLTQADTLEAAVFEFRKQTDRGTINLNTNGSLPAALHRVARAGLDSVRISMASAREETFNIYHQPSGYTFMNVVESIKASIKEGLYTALNLLVFPGVTDLPVEVEALERLISETNLNMIHLRNLSIDPQLYLDRLPAELLESGEPMGLLTMAKRLKKKFPNLDLGYFNRPKELFDSPLVDELPWVSDKSP